MSQREHMKSLMEKLQCIEESPYLMEMIKKDDYLTIAYENLSEEMGYKGAKDYILNEFKQIRHILKGFDKLPVREQKIIVDIIEGFNDSAEDLIRKRAAKQAAAAPGTPLSDFGSVGKARAERAAAAAAERAAAEKAAQAAAAAPAAPAAPTTQSPTTQSPTTQSPTTQAPTTQAPTTQAPTTQAPTTQAPTTQAPSQTTQSPTTQSPTAAPAAGGPSMMDRIKGMGAAGKNMATSAANWVKNNKGKLGWGALGLAGAAGLGLAGKAAYDWYKNKNQPAPTDPMNSPDANLANDPNKGAVKPQPKPPGPKPGGGGQKPAAGGLTPEELAELDAIAGEWENVQDPTIINLLGAYGQVRSKLASPQAPPAVPGAVANQPGGQKAPAAPVAAQGGGAM